MSYLPQKYNNIHFLWLIMIFLTLLSYGFGKFGLSGLTSVFILLLSVVIKGIIIIRDFMELRDVSLLWRVIMYGWLWAVTLSIAIIYFLGS